MVLTQKRNTGNLGEKVAAKYLKDKGYSIIETNYRNTIGHQVGEIDIIAKEKEEIVFVEVKTRDYDKYNDTLPEENITSGKLKKLARIANIWLRKKKLYFCDYRFDAISVWLDAKNKKAKVKHIDHL